MRILIALLLAVVVGAGAVGARGLNQRGYAGAARPINLICDSTSTPCVEAYGVSFAATKNYSGALFQIAVISSPTTVMDVGQNADHSADLTGVLSFCGGTYANCAISKIYNEIQAGTTNVLLPSTYNPPFGPNCVAGGLTCACALVIETATGLPIIQGGFAGNGYTQCEYALGGNDQAMAGLSPGAINASVAQVSTNQPFETCCGNFLLAHQYALADTPNDSYDLGNGYTYGTAGAFNVCTTSVNYCYVQEGGSGTQNADLGTVQRNAVAIATIVGSTMSMAGYINGTQVLPPFVTSTHTQTLTSIHLCGGGDLSQPAYCTNMREMAIWGTTLTQADANDIQIGVNARYPSLTFAVP